MKRSRALFFGVCVVPLISVWAAVSLARSVPAAAVPVRIDAVPPELTAGQWINTPDSKPLTLSSLKGKVTIVHFWTFG